jgi:hypothetical protein
MGIGAMMRTVVVTLKSSCIHYQEFKLVSLVQSRVYIKKILRLVGLWMQRNYLLKIFFYEII